MGDCCRTCSPCFCHLLRVRGKSWKHAQHCSHSGTRLPAHLSTPGGVVAAARLNTWAAGIMHSIQHWAMKRSRQLCHPRRLVPTCRIPCHTHAACHSFARCLCSTARQLRHVAAERLSSAPPTPSHIRTRMSSSAGSSCHAARRLCTVVPGSIATRPGATVRR